MPFFTIGHSTRTIAEFVDQLRLGPVEMVVDIRTIPKSRTNPQYNEDALAQALSDYQIGHCRIASLGGLRGRVRDVPPEVNGWWKHRSFHNYADHALSTDFRSGLDELIRLGCDRRVAIMCSEAVWWRCHRRIVADHLLVAGKSVFHLMGNRVEPAKLSAGAVAANGRLTYPEPGPLGAG